MVVIIKKTASFFLKKRVPYFKYKNTFYSTFISYKLKLQKKYHLTSRNVEPKTIKKALHLCKAWCNKRSHLGSNQGTADYESVSYTF
jgi:hypothetical protein